MLLGHTNPQDVRHLPGSSLTDLLKKRILIMDGAMGTMLQRYGLSGNSEAFNITHPEVIARIHSEYIDAGADIIETNTFGANSISQREYGNRYSAYTLALEGARIARRAADAAQRHIWVAGSIGPTGKSLSLAQDISDPSYRVVSFDQMVQAYAEQVRGLVDGGVDILLLETCFDALNAKAAIYAILHTEGAKGIPVMISVSPSDRSGRTLSGQTIEAFYRSVQHAPLIAFGLNCSLGARDMKPLVEDASQWASCAVSCYPNAGLPNEMGQYDESAESMATEIRKMAEEGLVNIVGGCCGTTPEHIRAIAGAVRDLRPRTIPVSDAKLHISGLESMSCDVRTANFINIGERTNVAGSRRFAKMIAAGQYEQALSVAAGQIEGGASIIDINMDDAMLDSTAEMERFMRYVSNDPSVAKAAIMVDSSHWETILAGLKNAQGKCMVNSISLKDGHDAFIAKAREIRSLGAAAVVMAFDEKGQATTFERKIEICSRAYDILTSEVGMNASDIIFDVNVLSVGTGMTEHARYGIDFIEAVRWIKKNLPGALTSGGISNLSFAFRGNNAVREAMHSVFLYHAVKAGLDMGIVNPGMLRIYEDIEPSLLRCVEDVILDSDPGATERLIAMAQHMLEQKTELAAEAVHQVETDRGTIQERLRNALIKGNAEYLHEDISEALDTYGSAVAIIEGPLMEGMGRVGELFGDGKMFLPQVIKSAKVMRDAVELLQPYIDGAREAAGRAETAQRPKAVIATVKGDVHDIGKNITAIVLTCNGFDITDLGVMVDKETILQRAAQLNADIICCSGLITPSLYQMEEICREMAARGLSTPLLIGGATTSALHTAVKLAPLYEHVFYGADASSSAVLAKRLVSDRQAAEKSEHASQERIRRQYAARDSRNATLQASDGSSRHYDRSTFLHGKVFDDMAGRTLPVTEVLPYFDWNTFFAVWGLKSDVAEDQKNKLQAEANGILNKMEEEQGDDSCRITVCARFEACHSEGDDIIFAGHRFPMLRQGESLSDLVAPSEYGFDSPAGIFAISVNDTDKAGHGHGCSCQACNSYEAMMERTIRLTLAEAASCWLDRQLKLKLEGCCQHSGRIPAKIIKPAAGYASCPDHSLKRDILALLPGHEALGITLTESCAMIPDASICGFIFAHPEAHYPEIRRVDDTTLKDYSARRGFTDEEQKIFLSHLK